MKIIPDQDFFTNNTAELKELIEAIPNVALCYEENVFEKDFKLVLNFVKEGQKNYRISYCCEECNFRASSQRGLKAHITFTHGSKFCRCEECPMKTETE